MGPKVDRSTIAQQVRDDLRARIKSGELSAGAQAPSESECCTIYGVSRVTVREAYRLLEQEGLIQTKHGSGRYVLPGASDMMQGSLNLAKSTVKTLEDLGYTPSIEVLGTMQRRASAEETKVLGLNDGALLVEVERAYLHGRELLVHAVNVIEIALLPKPLELMDWSSSVANVFSKVGRQVSSGYIDVSAVRLPGTLADRFEVPEDSAWMKFDGPMFDQHGAALWWTRELWRGDVRPLRVVNRRDPSE